MVSRPISRTVDDDRRPRAGLHRDAVKTGTRPSGRLNPQRPPPCQREVSTI
jgi:hypothetical protein